MLYPRLLDLSTASTDPVTRIFTRLSSLAVRKRINTKGSSDQQPAKELEKIHSTTNQRWKYKLGRKPASISNCFSMACHIEISRHFLPICWRDFVAKIVGRPSDGFRSMRVCITGNNQWPTSSILDIHLIIDLRIRKERRNRP
jgi:hypothetical protein